MRAARIGLWCRAVCRLLACVALASQASRAQASGGRIYFIDIGQGASTLIVSPAGRTMLVDGGPDSSAAKVIALLNTLGITTVDYTVLTHYHVDHDAGLTGLINAGRVFGTAYDNGDDPSLVPPNAGTTLSAYNAYKAAIAAHASVTRQTITPGTVVDLGGGMRVTCIAAGGKLLSGGEVTISNTDLNTESISVFVEYNDFDFLVSGDLTGGGSTSTASTPDVETFVAQQVGDVDVVQLNHHGSTTASNQRFLSALKAEVAVAQAGVTNTFGHPNRETANRYLHTPVTNGHTFTPTTPAVSGAGPVFYQTDPSPTGDDRVTEQGLHGPPGNGTIELRTDGTSTYTLSSLDDGGVSIPAASNTYAVDGISAGVTTDFAPTVMPAIEPPVPRATDAVVVSAAIHDRESSIGSATLQYALNGVPQAPVPMALVGARYEAGIPAQPDGTRIDFTVVASDGAHTTAYSSGYFSGVTAIDAVRAIKANGEPRYAGYAARVQGVVTAGTGTFGTGQNDDYVQDATGAINVFRTLEPSAPAIQPMNLGDTVSVAGRIGFNGGRIRLEVTPPFASLTTPYGVTVSSTGPAPVPTPVTLADINAAPESYEGRLVTIAGVTVTSGTLPAIGASSDAFVTVADATASLLLKIDHDTDVPGLSTPTAPFQLVGIVQQDDYLRPFDSGYSVAPRGRTDLGAPAAGSVLMTIADARADLVDASGNPGADFVPDRLGQTVKVRGAVTSVDFRGGAGVDYYVQDATGGIDLFSSTLAAGPFSIGDSVEAIGAVTQFNGLTEITVTSVTLLEPGAVAAAVPQVITLARLANGGVGEALEGRLVRVGNLTVTAGAFPAANADANLTVEDGTGSATLRIDRDTDIDGTPTPAGTFSVVAVVGQFDTSAPFDSGYQLIPRTLADIVVSAPPALTVTPTSVNFGSVFLGQSATQTITIKNAGSDPMTLTPPFAIAGANATEFAAGAVDTTLAPGESATLSVTFIPVGDVGSRSATLTVTASGFAPVAVTLIGSGQAAPVGLNTSVVISEFRVRGPSGGNDEFVEVYNNADAPVNIGGWKLKASNSAGATSTRATVPGGIVIPPRGHFLFVNSSASGYSGAVAGNQTYGTGITDDGGIAITRPDDTIVDQVGMSAGSAFKEGTPLPNLGTTSAANLNRGYERQLGGAEGSRIDTDNNAADFAVRTPSEPQNLASDPTPGITVAPATIEFGSLAIGRTAHAVVTVVNVTSAAADIGPVVAATGDISQFVVGAPGTTTLNAGASTAVDIAFAPSVTGAAAALVSVASSRGTRTISLSGTATPGITVTPASLDFGTIAFHDSASTIVMITNGDSAAVTLTPPFVVSGEEAAEFSVGAPATTSLASGASTSVAVTLTPVSLGAKSATLTITSANGGDRTVVLSASVVCPSILVGPASLPAGTVDVPYSQALTATGAPGPFMFDAIGMLPPGVTLDADGRLAGIPTATGTFAFTVHAMEATSCGASTSYALTIRRGTPTLTFPVPADMEYGTALGPAQLNAMSSVPGSFAYAPDAGTVLPLGPRQTLIAVFTPADAANYNGGTVTTTINVVDTTPPAIVAIAPGAATLWPPNKAMVPVALAVAATDAADRRPVCRVTSISSNEGTSADAQIVGALAVNLRADRNGDGGGRIYTIGVRCIDASGNASTSAATVTVPHDRR